MSAQQHMTASLGRAPPRLQQPSSLPAGSGCERGSEITYLSPVRWSTEAPPTEKYLFLQKTTCDRGAWAPLIEKKRCSIQLTTQLKIFRYLVEIGVSEPDAAV